MAKLEPDAMCIETRRENQRGEVTTWNPVVLPPTRDLSVELPEPKAPDPVGMVAHKVRFDV